jgi:hypothetical protein
VLADADFLALVEDRAPAGRAALGTVAGDAAAAAEGQPDMPLSAADPLTEEAEGKAVRYDALHGCINS